MATWEEWGATYDAGCKAIPEGLHLPCPDCGADHPFRGGTQDSIALDKVGGAMRSTAIEVEGATV